MPNNEKSNVQLWLALKLIPRLSVTNKIKLVDAIGINKLFCSNPVLSSFKLTAKQRAAIFAPDWQKIDDIINISLKHGSRIITFADVSYPLLLKEIYDPPLILFVKGNIKLLNAPQVAIVGSRSASISAREIAQSFARELSENGVTVTSGLALGVDSFAHKGAIQGTASTIAVVATGLDKVYPAQNRSLEKQLLEKNGCVISEFLPGTPPKAGHFPRRNRIISGLSYGVLVVEATMKSGTLITARTAIEQNRDVFAIPGSIKNANSQGCHWLIKQGAKLVDCSADILEELVELSIGELHLSNEEHKTFDKNVTIEKQDLFLGSLLASVGYEVTPVDVVVSRSKLSTSEVLSQLTMLELRGLVTAVPGGYLRL